MRRFAVVVALIVPLVAAAARGESPIAASRFGISVDGVQVAEFAGAQVNLSAKPPTVVLTQGREPAGKLEQWRVASARKQAVLVELDANGKPVARYNLTNAWPSSVQRSGGSMPIEKVELTCERIERVLR
jgi:hypothetical protein